jgi:hypothetical protein
MRVESARKLVEVARAVHAMFMASEIALQSLCRAHTIFMGCCRGLTWTMYISRRLR